MTSADIPAADQILRRAHGMDIDFSPLLRRNQRITPAWWWVLEQNGQVEGVVGATDYQTFAHIGLLAVNPGLQQRGAGVELMQTAMSAVAAAGRNTVTLYSTDAGLRLYDKLGFEWAGLSTEWELRENRTRADVGRRIERTTDFSRLARMDRPWFGGDREPVFDSLEAESPGRILLCDDEAGQGFVCAQPRVIGPFAASNPATAQALLAAALAFEYAAAPRVLVPNASSHQELILIRAGFLPVRTSRYFIKGPNPQASRDCLYGQAAYSLG